ncbi:hypothetical protein [Rhizobium sullae]|uniref:hypothetical protein n=1 Tax=Rhizobium sullae TaxID=50338 RepID=UPI003CC7C91E
MKFRAQIYDTVLAAFLVAGLLLVGGILGPTLAQEAVPSWNDTAAKTRIIDFVKATTTAGGEGYVAPEDRIAVFDNDGTLWSEQPIYFHFAFMLDRVKKLAPQHSEWKAKEPFKSILADDLMGVAKGGEKGIVDLAMIAKKIGAELRADPELGPLFIQPLKMKGVEEFGDYGIVLSFAMTTLPGMQTYIRRKAYAKIREAFKENSIEFATSSVHVGNDDRDGAAAAATAIRTQQAKAAAAEG